LLLAGLLLALLALCWAVLRHQREAAAATPVATCCEPAGLSAKPIHALRDRDFGGARETLVRNLLDGPIEARCSLVSPDNMRAVPALPRRLVLAAREERVVAELRPVDATRASRAAVACDAMVGDPRARPADRRTYGFPLPPGTRFTLDQGFDGRFSHDTPDSAFALDLGVPEGTPVLAARAGVVMQVEEAFRASGGDSARFGDRANFIRVLHDDGSMAVYAHLAPHSLAIRPGARVGAGQLLARSGNTGFSTGPHLHFSVQRNAGMALRSIPFNVAGVDPRMARR
jgi:murein DD-endopeptidase MepM/ murein hydrolase activator NlpD